MHNLDLVGSSRMDMIRIQQYSRMSMIQFQNIVCYSIRIEDLV